MFDAGNGVHSDAFIGVCNSSNSGIFRAEGPKEDLVL